MKFRSLTASEIDCRVATVNKNGCSLLLYKDARCDMNILDETVGPLNWQRSHTRDNANCTVSIWDESKSQWISKEDTGTESNTEKEKGLASDSFKRACFNWGIGRELYTAPFIWVSAGDAKVEPSGQKFTTKDKFEVGGIEVKDGAITSLQVKNAGSGKIVFNYKNGKKVQGNTKPPASTADAVPGHQDDAEKASPQMLKCLKDEMYKKGVTEKTVMDLCNVNDLMELTAEQVKSLMNKLAKTADRWGR